MTSADVMVKNIKIILQDTTIERAAELMIVHELNHLPVVSNEGGLVGIVTSWDIAKAVARRYTDLKDITSGPVITTSPEEPIEEAIKRMDEHKITALPVVGRDDRVLGMLTSEGIGPLLRRCR